MVDRSPPSSPAPPPPGTPAAEVDLDEETVHRLLETQHPDLADLPLHAFDSGWDNLMFRLGEELCLRFPRREVAVQLILNEQRWLPELAERLPLPIPAPLRVGAPGEGYPWPWSVIPWLDGDPADLEPALPSESDRLADFLIALHQPAPADAPSNPVRGVPLADRQAAIEERMRRLDADRLLPLAVTGLWRSALSAPIDVSDRWLHGDLHAMNVLTQHGALAGAIDWGDITAGDVATDLASLWMLFDDARDRERALDRYGASEATRLRARGWAVMFGVVFLDAGRVDGSRYAEIGRRTLMRLVAEAG